MNITVLTPQGKWHLISAPTSSSDWLANLRHNQEIRTALRLPQGVEGKTVGEDETVSDPNNELIGRLKTTLPGENWSIVEFVSIRGYGTCVVIQQATGKESEESESAVLGSRQFAFHEIGYLFPRRKE